MLLIKVISKWAFVTEEIIEDVETLSVIRVSSLKPSINLASYVFEALMSMSVISILQIGV